MAGLVGLVGCGAGTGKGSSTLATTKKIAYATRLDSLEGKTICELSLDEWQAHRVLPEIRRQLQALYPTAEFVPYTEFPMGLVNVGKPATAEALAQKACQCAIIANIG